MLIVFKCIVLPQIRVAWKSLRRKEHKGFYMHFEVSKGETTASSVRIF